MSNASLSPTHTEVLHRALELTTVEQQQAELQLVCDQACEVTRGAELWQSDTQNSIQFAMVRQQELQLQYTKQPTIAAHRLDILIEVLLTVARFSSAFGMNLFNGFE